MSNTPSLSRSFLKAELVKIRKTRNVIIGIFLAMFVFCYGFFLVSFFQKWSDSEDRLSFFSKSLPTLSFLFVYLGFAFGLLSWIAYIKNQKFIHALQQLNDDDLDIYQQYSRRLVRIFSAISPYLFCENEILFFPFIGNKQIPISQIHRIETKIIRNYRGPNSYRIYFYNEFNKIYQVTMNQKGAFDFLQEQLRKENPTIVVVARNH
ncbi:hypothetical protein ACR784_11045 [Sphingobacterium multivorum]|uniref:hypothetical protein n=1 Tax=Sphingobacterium multivorum TaxID=28454 RepID=UPI003DA503E8